MVQAGVDGVGLLDRHRAGPQGVLQHREPGADVNRLFDALAGVAAVDGVGGGGQPGRGGDSERGLGDATGFGFDEFGVQERLQPGQ